MESIAAVFDEHGVVPIPERHVVERRVLEIALEEQRELAAIGIRRGLRDLHDATEAAEVGTRGGGGVGVSGFREVELPEADRGPEQSVLRSFEWRGALR